MGLHTYHKTYNDKKWNQIKIIVEYDDKIQKYKSISCDAEYSTGK